MNNEDFQRLKAGVQEMVDIEQGKKQPNVVYHVCAPDVKEIRAKTGLSQAQFALKYGIEKKTLQHWEHGRRNPVGPAVTLLRVIAAHPEAVEDTVARMEVQEA